MIEAIELTSTRRSRGPGGGPVEQVSFDVYPGQVTALLGAPGAGKSTVLRMMVELEPASGRTLFGGRPYRALRPAVREVGLALNPDALHPGRTVQAHLQLYSAAGGVPKARIAEVLEIAGLSTQSAVRCGRLDPGQRQRLAIAAALIGDPSALILDEPHALDTHGMSWFHALIRAYAAQGRTVLVAATDPDSLAGTADHVVVLRRAEDDGISRVIASRSAAEVFDERRATVVQVRSPQAARLAAALETEGARLSPAGPGALQVRGLDRARIGEVAHVAGICLHELSEIGHDDDVFGLRPVPRQKELLPGHTPVDAEDGALWTSGVRLLTMDGKEIEEAEVVEPQPTAVAHAPLAEWRGWSGLPGQSVAQGGGEAAAKESQATAAAAAAQTAAEAELLQTAESAPIVVQAGSPVVESSAAAGPAASSAVSEAAAGDGVTAEPVAESSALASPAVPTGAPQASAGAVVTAVPVGLPIAEGSAVPSAPSQAAAAPPPKRASFATFRWGRGRSEAPVVQAASSSVQPAVPFTVAAPARQPADDGMTPWRAVAVRAGQQQGSDGASAEQEASA